jgi:hypothetical protein
MLKMKLEFFLGLITWKIRLVLILVKHFLAAARNDVAFVASVFPFKQMKPHFTVLHCNLFTSSLKEKCCNRSSRAIGVDAVDHFFISYLARVCH